MQSPDALIAQALIAGHPTALEDAYRLYAPRCRAAAWRVLRDDSLAQDAVQEAFVSLWRHRDGLVIRAAGIGPWLVVAARNAALNMVRTATRRSARETSVAQPEDVDPFAGVEASAQRAHVREALAQLSPEQRTVITLAYFGERTLRQIAESTDTPLGTVKRRAQLGLARLGKILGASPS